MVRVACTMKFAKPIKVLHFINKVIDEELAEPVSVDSSRLFQGEIREELDVDIDVLDFFGGS